MTLAILDISVTPVGTGEASISSFVAETCKVVKDMGLKYQVTPTGTVIEGDLDSLMKAASTMHHMPFNRGANRVITNITIDDRHDKRETMESSVQAVVENI